MRGTKDKVWRKAHKGCNVINHCLAARRVQLSCGGRVSVPSIFRTTAKTSNDLDSQPIPFKLETNIYATRSLILQMERLHAKIFRSANAFFIVSVNFSNSSDIYAGGVLFLQLENRLWGFNEHSRSPWIFMLLIGSIDCEERLYVLCICQKFARSRS